MRIGSDVISPWRSAAKPLQLACALEVLGDPELSQDELAVAAASHSGEPQHVAVVDRLLACFGGQRSDLKCGAHPPMFEPHAGAILRAGGAIEPIHNNCSGKHAMMIAAARSAGWELDYRPADHPLQRVIYGRIARWSGVEPALAVDGCGVPTFCLPVSAMATAWRAIATAMRDAPDSRLGRIGRAMAARPELTSGTGRLDLAVVQAASEPMAVKIGAGGLFCIALPERDMGIAIKVISGDSDALAVAVGGALDELAPGAFIQPVDWPWAQVRNVVGLVVGERRTQRTF